MIRQSAVLPERGQTGAFGSFHGGVHTLPLGGGRNGPEWGDSAGWYGPVWGSCDIDKPSRRGIFCYKFTILT